MKHVAKPGSGPTYAEPMCGRYVLRSAPRRIREQFGIPDEPGWTERWTPRFNLAPQQDAPIVRVVDGARRLDLLHWGLVPFWADDPGIGHRLINARSETAPDKPAFRAAFKSRRCIVPADGFYEWQQRPSGKQPFYIHRQDGALLAMAGLWEHWTAPTGAVLQSFTILTTEANAAMRALHDRMPVILRSADVESWLDPGSKPEALRGLLRPLGDGELEAYPVSKAVGNVRNDRPELLAPLP